MKPVELNILWWDDNQAALNDIGLRPDISTCGTSPITFYNIDSIAPYTEDGVKYTAIRSGGIEYIYGKSYEHTKLLIEGLTS